MYVNTEYIIHEYPLKNPHLKNCQYGQLLCLLLTDNDSCTNEEPVAKTLVLYLLKLYLLFKLLSLANCYCWQTVIIGLFGIQIYCSLLIWRVPT